MAKSKSLVGERVWKHEKKQLSLHKSTESDEIFYLVDSTSVLRMPIDTIKDLSEAAVKAVEEADEE